MKTQELLDIAKARGLNVKLVNGRPILNVPAGKQTEVTDELLACLKRHRERIIAMLSKESPP